MTHDSRQAVGMCTSWEYGWKFETVTLNGSFININNLVGKKLQCKLRQACTRNFSLRQEGMRG